MASRGMSAPQSDVTSAGAATLVGASASRVESATSGVFRRGATIGRYVVLDRLGAGGMGVVYAAYDPQLDRSVAIKVVRGDQGGAAARERLLREAQAMAKLSHPNLVTIFDAGVHEGELFLAMELVRGMTLSAWLAATPRTPTEILAAFVRAGDGLAAAHAFGIVHRDFKPDNVLVRADDGRVLVGDFGLARPIVRAPIGESVTTGEILESGEVSLTRGAIGTPAFMAPEQQRGEAVDARSDEFAFCVSLFWSLYGVHPFDDGKVALGAAIALGKVQGKLPDIGIPRAVRDAILRGLSKDPDERWPSMSALLDVLRADPSRARRRLLGAGVAGAVIVGLVAASPWRSDASSVCDSIASRGSEVWNDAHAEEIRAALRGTGDPHADEAWQGVTDGLTAYIGRWREGYESACRATHETRDLDVAVFERRAYCYGTRLDHVAALVELLRQPDAPLVGRAVTAVDDLPSLGPCEGEGSARETDDREAAIEIRSMLAQAQTLRLAGRTSQVEPVVDAALRRAEAIGSDTLRAQVLLEAADLYDARLEVDRAGAAHREALAAATRGDDPETLANAWIGWVAHLVHTDRAEDAAQWVDVMRASVARVPGDHLAWLLELTAGNVEFARGRMAEAERQFRLAIDLLQATPHAPPTRIATAWMNLGAALASQGDYDGALVAFGETLRLREARLGPSHLQVAFVLRQIAITHRAAGRSRAAFAPAQRAFEIDRAALGEDHLTVASSRVLVAKLAADIEDTETAMSHAREVIATPGADSPAWRRERALAWSALGEALRTLGRREEAREAFVTALALRDGAPPNDLVIMGIQVQLAPLEAELGNIARAREIAAAALEARSTGVADDHIRIADGLEVLAAVETEAGAFDLARAYRARALEIRSRNGDRTHSFGARVRFAELEQRAGQPDAALAMIAGALADPGEDPEPSDLALAHTLLVDVVTGLAARPP
jgi:tetratricopeptide (TPR) repeat protein